MAHLKTTTNFPRVPKDFYCEVCNFQFGNKYLIDVHLKIMHGKKIGLNEESITKDFEYKICDRIDIKEESITHEFESLA